MGLFLRKKGFIYNSLLLLLLCQGFIARAQRTQVSGTVYTDERQPLGGVTVSVKGEATTTTSDKDGSWKLTVPGGNATLVFSYVGYVTKQEAVKGRAVFNVVMASSNKTLEDVVVIGYTSVKRRDLTGSVSSVSARQLKDIPVNSAAEALTGRLAGVQIVSSEGKPGSDYTITVRGGGSITQDNSPLYVIDGIQVENGLANLAPQDIESVDVLKDAA
ncbi:MAG: TonB-dependent receptor plug domain-containing protein, partial [Bacteroidetes bacterium]|nr:TonB-dependent receptor plug domain-containing protein [Bacteroidota bacterium]